jgi:O-succinylbenzoic acid--CoA ligase
MKNLWTMFTNLRLNGLFYNQVDLKTLAQQKISDPSVADWEKAIFQFITDWLAEVDFVEVNTSGSTGKPKRIRLEKNRMLASAKATNSFFCLDESKNALLCLSSDFIAGKMMIVRAFVGGFDLHYLEPKTEVLFNNNSNFDFVAVVPMQLEAVFKSNQREALKRFRTLIVGGAALNEAIVKQIAEVTTEIWMTYGMTETISHIALRAINGTQKSELFIALDGISIDVDQRDCLRINAPTLNSQTIQTNDRVEWINNKEFRFLGRIDFVINSGGIKLSPELLEQKTAPFLKFEFAYSSLPDAILGEKLILVMEQKAMNTFQSAELKNDLEENLEKFEQPKEIRFVAALPRTENGKIDRKALQLLIASR